MNFVSRATGVLTAPQTELPRAAAEPATTGGLVGGYAAILAALPSIGGLLGGLIFAGGLIFYAMGSLIAGLLLTYALRDLGLTIGVGIALAALAPAFGGQRNSVGAMKLAVYAATPIWIAGFIAGLLPFTLGGIGMILVIVGFAYAGYIIYLGAQPLLGVPAAQAPAVAGIATIGWLVLYFVVQMIVLNLIIGSMFAGFGRYGI